MLKKKCQLLYWSPVIVMIIGLYSGCRCNDQRPPGDPVTLTVSRFEEDLFSLDTQNMAAEILFLKEKYGSFFDLFAFRITSLGSRDSALMYERFKSFVSDTNFRKVYDDCREKFSDFGRHEEKIARAFQYYLSYFPGKPVPELTTMISGFSFPVVCDSGRLAISLDMYLGPANFFYSTLEPPVPVYLRRRMHEAFIPCDALKGWAMSDYEIDESSANMMDQMIAQGRILYFLEQVLPGEPDSLKTGYTQEQLDWCFDNERRIWSFFIENKLLFSNDPNLMNKYVNEGPSTQGFPGTAPGNIGQFIGWQIVRAYMKNNAGVTLASLMEQDELMEIYNGSSYKPAR
jgi:hypothetical protein